MLLRSANGLRLEVPRRSVFGWPRPINASLRCDVLWAIASFQGPRRYAACCEWHGATTRLSMRRSSLAISTPPCAPIGPSARPIATERQQSLGPKAGSEPSSRILVPKEPSGMSRKPTSPSPVATTCLSASNSLRSNRRPMPSACCPSQVMLANAVRCDTRNLLRKCPGVFHEALGMESRACDVDHLTVFLIVSAVRLDSGSDHPHATPLWGLLHLQQLGVVGRRPELFRVLPPVVGS